MEGYEKKPHNVQKITRRNVLGGIGSGVALAAMAKVGLDNYHTDEVTDTVETSIEEKVELEVQAEEPVFEQLAEDLESPVFDKVLAAREIEMGGLSRDQVLFIDSFGRQLTQPFTITESLGRSVEDMTWRFEGGKAVGITGDWTRIQKEYVSKETGIAIEEIGMLHVYQDLDNTDQLDMTSKVEAAYVNATTPESHDPTGRDALTILREECVFPNIPEPLATDLQTAMIGIACEESRFKAGKESRSGALGLLQVMPDNIKAFAEKHDLSDPDPENLSLQIGVAIEHVEVCYRQLVSKLDVELPYLTELYFNGNKASMEKYLLLPLIINSYNTGQDRMIDVVQWFIDSYPEPQSAAIILGQEDTLSGYDLYQAIVYQCDREDGVDRFGDDSSNYVERVMGWQRAFVGYEANQALENVQLAQN